MSNHNLLLFLAFSITQYAPKSRTIDSKFPIHDLIVCLLCFKPSEINAASFEYFLNGFKIYYLVNWICYGFNFFTSVFKNILYSQLSGSHHSINKEHISKSLWNSR